MATSWEIGRHWRQIRLSTDVYDQIHTNHNVEQEMTMEQPEPWKQTMKSGIEMNFDFFWFWIIWSKETI